MKVAAIQMTSGPDVAANLAQARTLLLQARDRGARLAALPENFAFMGLQDADKRAVGEEEGHGPIQDFIAGIPRYEALIIQGPTAQNADWFNLWAPGGGASVNGQQQLTTDTLWWINPEGGEDAWTNALATEPPI